MLTRVDENRFTKDYFHQSLAVTLFKRVERCQNVAMLSIVDCLLYFRKLYT